MSNTNFKEKEVRKKIQFTKCKNYPGTHLTKVVKGLCNGNSRTTKKQWMKKLEDRKIAHGSVWQCKS